MKSKKTLVLMEIILIIILITFCFILEYRINNFTRDCKVTFDINGTCPCLKTRFDSNSLNLTVFNNSNN